MAAAAAAPTGAEALEVELSKISVAKLAPEDTAMPDKDVLAEIAKELEERPNPTRITSARARRPGSRSSLSGVPGEPGTPLLDTLSPLGPVPPGAPMGLTARRGPPKPKEDDISAMVEPSGEGDQVFEVKDGKAQAKVSDRLEPRAAFLFYTGSNYKPNEMHRMTFNVPYMKPEQLLLMCQDLELLEPKGPLSKMALGITYTTMKAESDPGLSYAVFLDVLLELAFESGRNVAGQVVATHAKREQQLLVKATQRMNPMSETGLLRGSLRTSQSILRGFSESGFKNTSRSDPNGVSQSGPPMLAPGMSFRSRFSDCGRAFAEGEAGTTWLRGSFPEGEPKPHPPGANIVRDGRSRAAIREARKLRPSMSGAVRNWNAVDADGTIQTTTVAAAGPDAHPLHAAAFRPPTINSSPTATMGRSPSLSRTSRFSRSGAEGGDWSTAAATSPVATPEEGQGTGASSPMTWSTETSVTSPLSVLPKAPGSRPSSGLKSPQTLAPARPMSRPPSAQPKDGVLSAAPPPVAVHNA